MMQLCDARPSELKVGIPCGWFAGVRRSIENLGRRSTRGPVPGDGGWFVVRDPHHFDRFLPGDVVRLVRAPGRGEMTGRYQRFPDGLIDDVMPHSLDPSAEPAGYVAGEWPPAGLVHRWPPDLAAVSGELA